MLIMRITQIISNEIYMADYPVNNCREGIDEFVQMIKNEEENGIPFTLDYEFVQA